MVEHVPNDPSGRVAVMLNARCERRPLVLLAFGAGGLALGARPARSQDLPAPSSRVLLVARGLIGRRNGEDEARLDQGLLEAMGTSRLVTFTPWTDGEIEFEGVRLSSLVEHLRASGGSLTARALNDYFVTIPMSDVIDYDPLMAWSADGIPFTRRDKGPFWIVYPWSSHPDLNNRLINQRAIWQLTELEFHD